MNSTQKIPLTFPRHVRLYEAIEMLAERDFRECMQNQCAERERYQNAIDWCGAAADWWDMLDKHDIAHVANVEHDSICAEELKELQRDYTLNWVSFGSEYENFKHHGSRHCND